MSENQVAKKEPSSSERFMNMVVSEFGSGVSEVNLTNFQKRLAQNYFIAIDGALKSAEQKRLAKTYNQDPLPVLWANINMEKLARDVVSAARVGYDPAQPNHINMMPFKNNNLQKYDIVFIPGYRGIEMKSTKYGLDVPDHVAVELVYSTDRFKSIKKDRNNEYEGYEFEIQDDFNRGDIIGGFYFHIFLKAPEKNKLVVMSMKDIEKRKPAYASAEFWGGEKDEWKNGKKTGKKIAVEGWVDKMCWKMIYRAAYSDITIDSQKIDDDFMRLRQMESELVEAEAEMEIKENANRNIIDVEAKVTEAPDKEEPAGDNPPTPTEPPPAAPAKTENKKSDPKPKPAQATDPQPSTNNVPPSDEMDFSDDPDGPQGWGQ